MIPTKIESLVRRYTWVNTSQYSQAEFLEDLNMVKDIFWNKIVATWLWKRYYDIINTNSVFNQTEYVLPIVSSTTASIKTIKWVDICYDWKTYPTTWELIYIPATEVNPHQLPYDWEYYKVNQSPENPIFYAADKSVFIAPVPDKDITNWVKIEWIKKIADYDIDTTEADMKIDIDYHSILLLWVIPYALMSKRVSIWEIQKAQNDYTQAETIALRSLEEMVDWPWQMKYPDYFTSYYE